MNAALDVMGALRRIARTLGGLVFTDTANRIKFSSRLYVRVVGSDLTLVSLGIDNVQTHILRFGDAKQIFAHAQAACEARSNIEARFGDTSWTFDARSETVGGNKVAIQINGPLGFVYEVADRNEVVDAIASFNRMYA